MSFIEGQGPHTEPIELVSVNAVDMTCTVGDRYTQTSGIKMFNRGGELVCKPYLRPMSSMTKEENEQMYSIYHKWFLQGGGFNMYVEVIDFLNAHHFDYHGLIEKGLALDCTGLNIY